MPPIAFKGIHGVNNVTFLEVPFEMTIAKLRRVVAEKAGVVRPELVTITFNGSTLADESTVGTAGLVGASIVRVRVRAEPPPLPVATATSGGGTGAASAATTAAAAAVGTVTVKAVVTVRHHVKFLTRAKFSPDGALLATSSQDHHVILYNFTWTAGDGGTGVTVALDKVVDREFTGSTGKFGAGIRHWLRASRPCENLCIVLELCTVC